MRRLLSYLVSSLLILLAFWPQSTLLSAYKNNFYWQQQQMRQSQMLQQQQMRQQQMLQQQRMRQQQEQMRRQQEQARRQQEQMRRQMQERQRQAQLQRQRTAERQRQMQQDRQRKTLEQQRSQAQRQQFAKQQKALQQQKSLREQRKTKLRQDRLRRLQNDRLKKRQADKKKQDGRTTLTLATLLKRNSASVTLPKPNTRIASKNQTQKQFQEKRQQQLNKLHVTKLFEKLRKTIQARAQKARQLQTRLSGLLSKVTVKGVSKNVSERARKAFSTCAGGRCSPRVKQGIVGSQNVSKIPEARPAFAPGSAGAARPWTAKGTLRFYKLPTRGKIRYVPPKDWKATNDLPRGPNNGILDRFGNEWTKGPSRTKNQPFEWDVQLSRNGKLKLGYLSKSGSHVNVSLDGKVTH